MKYVVCSVRDEKSGLFARPVFTATVGLAVRSFFDECKREAPDNLMFTHREDFSLWKFGLFDDEQGTFECSSLPELVVRGDSVS